MSKNRHFDVVVISTFRHRGTPVFLINEGGKSTFRHCGTPIFLMNGGFEKPKSTHDHCFFFCWATFFEVSVSPNVSTFRHCGTPVFLITVVFNLKKKVEMTTSFRAFSIDILVICRHFRHGGTPTFLVNGVFFWCVVCWNLLKYFCLY